MEKKLFKISFTGDIMCEKPLLRAACQNGKYNFSYVFENISSLLQESNAVVGNLETVFAGEKSGYTKELYSFNTPDNFAVEMKKAGIRYVSTANNHCLDRGIDGINRTLHLLDDLGIKHFGTARSEKERNKIVTIDIGEKKVALLSYTYGTNIEDNHIYLPKDKEYAVNMLKSQKNEERKFLQTVNKDNIRSRISKRLRKFTTLEQRMKIKARLGILHNSAKIDNIAEGDIVEENISKMKQDVKRARGVADIVIMCLHSGGLFNQEIGTYTEYIMRELENAGVDIVIGNHPHVVQKFRIFDSGMKTIYSLGNFSISASSVYILHENHPEISVLFHVYLNQDTCKVEKISGSLLKIVEKKNGMLTVAETTKLYHKLIGGIEKKELFSDCKKVYYQLTGTSENFEMKKEYTLWEKGQKNENGGVAL